MPERRQIRSSMPSNLSRARNAEALSAALPYAIVATVGIIAYFALRKMGLFGAVGQIIGGEKGVGGGLHDALIGTGPPSQNVPVPPTIGAPPPVAAGPGKNVIPFGGRIITPVANSTVLTDPHYTVRTRLFNATDAPIVGRLQLRITEEYPYLWGGNSTTRDFFSMGITIPPGSEIDHEETVTQFSLFASAAVTCEARWGNLALDIVNYAVS